MTNATVEFDNDTTVEASPAPGVEPELDTDEAIIDVMLDVVNDNPPILREMLKAVLAVDSWLKMIGKVSAVDADNPLIPGLQALFVAHEIIEIRKPLPEELGDPEWHGHAAGFTADTDIAASRDDFTEASAELIEALGLDGDGEETAEAAQ